MQQNRIKISNFSYDAEVSVFPIELLQRSFSNQARGQAADVQSPLPRHSPSQLDVGTGQRVKREYKINVIPNPISLI